MLLNHKAILHPIMRQERQAELLREEIRGLLSHLFYVTDLYDLSKEPLSKPRRGLSVDAAHGWPWPLIPLMVCDAICGHYEHALPAAAAMQLLLCAGDVFDDIEDGDSSDSLPAKYGLAIATNAATTLTILAEKAITRLREREVADCVVVQVMDMVNSYYIGACVGQHLDLSLKLEDSMCEDTYLRVVKMKSASQIECACKVGALLANAKRDLVDVFADFGQNLGMAAQIINDIQGIINGSDVAKRVITLPVIYALTQADTITRNQLMTAYQKPVDTMSDNIHLKDLMFRTGAVHYAIVKMEFYRQQALDALCRAKDSGVVVEQLKLFLE